MNDKDHKLLEEFVEYKDKAKNKYIVINKSNISSIEDNVYETIITLRKCPVSGHIYYYEFDGHSTLTKVMELYEKAYVRSEEE